MYYTIILFHSSPVTILMSRTIAFGDVLKFACLLDRDIFLKFIMCFCLQKDR